MFGAWYRWEKLGNAERHMSEKKAYKLTSPMKMCTAVFLPSFR